MEKNGQLHDKMLLGIYLLIRQSRAGMGVLAKRQIHTGNGTPFAELIASNYTD
jgi:hypothetical protein